MKKLLLLCLLISQIAVAQETTLYHRAKIFYNSPEELALLSNIGIETDHGNHKKGVFIESDFSSSELEIVKEAGYQTEITIRDVQSYYINRGKRVNADIQTRNFECAVNEDDGFETPQNFELGSMAGFFTYDEILAELDQMAELYPNLITARSPINNFETSEGRSIFWLRMSDNPNMDEDEPEMLYDAVHHAREPASVSTLIYYMWYLLENYENDPEIASILDNSELYFVPVLNPDGYQHNVNTNPNGGGLWRKNRRNHNNGNFGVDNNRNYGIEWGTTGISFNTDSDVFPGDGPFSEPENQALKWFTENHEFLIAFNNHSFGNLLLFPFGYGPNLPTPEHDTYVAISSEMVTENGFVNQLSAELSVVSGDSDDWMYTSTPEKARIFAFTPEIGSGSQGFWPAPGDIIPLSNSTLSMNITAAHMITKYATIEDQSPQTISTLNGQLNFELKRLGFQESDFSVTVNPVSDNITISEDAVVFAGLELLQSSASDFSFELSPEIVDGDVIQYQYVIDNGDYLQVSEVYSLIFGTQSVIFEDQGSDVANWENSPWTTTSQEFISSPSSITDSPNGNYNNNVNTSIVLSNEISLDGVESAFLTFNAQWEIETNWDYVQVEVSTDNGNNWIPQCGNFTVIGNNNQALNEPLYHGIQNTWIEENISLSDYIDEDILIRFQIVTDGFVTEDGFYFDDVMIKTIGGVVSGVQEINLDGAFVSQNSPNPTTDISAIEYNLPEGVSNGQLIIRNYLGQEIERQDLIGTSNSLSVNVSNYPAGSYFYSLEANEVIYITKKMIVIR